MKKRMLFAGSAVIALGIIIVVLSSMYLSNECIYTGDIPSFPITTGSSGPYVLASSYPTVNDTYPIYKIIPIEITDGKIKDLGKVFGLAGEIQNYIPSAGILRLTDNNKDPYEILEVNRYTGVISFQIPSKALPYTTDKQPNLPSDEEARDIALKYLQERNLLPDNAHFTTVSIGSQYTHKTIDTFKEYNLTKNVGFMKTINGFLICNSGMTVTLGDGGEVVGVSTGLREIDPEPIRYVKVISPEQAYQKLLSNDVEMQYLPEDYDEVIVRDIGIAYWIGEYLTPVYIFSCVNVKGDSQEQVWQYVSAIDPSEIQDIS